MDAYFPTCLRRDLAEREHDVRAFTEGADGGFQVRVAWPSSARELWLAERGDEFPLQEVTLDFDPVGRLIRREQGTGGWHITWDFEYDDRCPPQFAVPSRVIRTTVAQNHVSTLVLVSVELVPPDAAIQATSAEAARARSIENGRRAAEAQAAFLRGDPPPWLSGDARSPASPSISSGDEPTLSSKTRPRLPGAFDKYRWPLILTGVAAVAIGVLGWWRRARS